MDATILPGPRSQSPSAAPARRGRPPQHPIGRPCALSFGNHRRGRRRGIAHRSVDPHRAEHFHLPSSAGDADPARLCRQGAGPQALCLGRPHPLSRPCLPAGRSAAPRAALYGDSQPGDRRNRAPRRVAGRHGGHAGNAGRAPRRARRHRQDRPRGSAARDLGRQGDPRLAAGRRDPPHRRRRHEALHRQHHHRISRAD